MDCLAFDGPYTNVNRGKRWGEKKKKAAESIDLMLQPK